MENINIFWFRRDLRIQDNAGLYHALKSNKPILPIFIFDKNILDKLGNKTDARVQFIYETIKDLKAGFNALHSDIKVFYDTPENAFKELIKNYKIDAVFTNGDYEPYAIDRDKNIAELVVTQGGEFNSFKDQVIFEKDEIMKDDGSPYTVYTPYSKKWKAKLNEFFLRSYPVEEYISNLFKTAPSTYLSLDEMGFSNSDIQIPPPVADESIMSTYNKTRDFPAIPGTTRIGIHLRFGTVSIRKLATTALEKNTTYLNELIWRDFYFSILHNFPKVAHGQAFKEAYDQIEWRNNEEEFDKWCKGQTGYPIVDAGMRQLNETGYMHNRLRMVTASFLSKHLLIDWRWGESYFADKLLDFDFSANNGGWQWAAGSGCDASPYFRIFNPYLQTEKFDNNRDYIRKYVPEFESAEYPKPIVDHEFARNRCLEVYMKAVKIEV